MSNATALRSDSPAGSGSDLLDLEALENTPLARDPFDHVIVPGFIGPDRLTAINADYPEISGPGNVKLEDLRYGPAFDALLAELRGPTLAARMGAKFGVDLSGRPQTITVRRFCEKTDGHIHVDHRTKIITMLIYFNQDWGADGGRLRFLRSADDIEDYAVEVMPLGGTMLAFRRSDTSFHGHKPFVGERRMLQLAWVEDGLVARTEKRVNRLSKPIRRLLNMS
jgi:SM-20-related protein